MKTSGTAVAFVLFLELALGWARGAAAQSPMDLTGSWTLNRASSQFPDEIGFGAGGGSRVPEGPRGPLILPETEEDARRRRFLTDEVRLPPERLTIVVTPASVTMTPDRGAARTVQPGRRDEGVTIGPITATTTAMWEGDRLTIGYTAEIGRVVRYTYAVNPSPHQLIVDVELVGRGGGDKVRRIYDPAPPGQPAGSQSNSAPPASVPDAPLPPLAAAAVDQRPDAPLKGLARLGLVVEGVGADAAKCGLQADAFESAVSKRLTDAGFRVLRNTDDETYLYVNVNAVTASAGLCVTRYDVTLYDMPLRGWRTRRRRWNCRSSCCTRGASPAGPLRRTATPSPRTCWSTWTSSPRASRTRTSSPGWGSA